MDQNSSRVRAAVSPLRRSIVDGIGPRRSIDTIIRRESPSEPLHCLRPDVVRTAASAFVSAFPGETMYAVKCNPEPAVLRAIWAGGVRHFDVASMGEIRLVATMFPEAHLSYMHPVKPSAAIREAYAAYGIRTFALDHPDELEKIRVATGDASDLTLVIRIAVPKSGAAYELSGKFGADADDAASLLRAARPHARRVGLTFHVGSQCVDPGAYARAIRLAAQVSALAQTPLDILDVGGGFPVSYPDVTPPPLTEFAATIRAAVSACFPSGVALFAEPGRALVAAGTSVVVQVDLRKGDRLYINDGVYGSLSDAGVPAFRFPARLLRRSTAAMQPFGFYGPTCDSADRMDGPFHLPGDVTIGDWIEIGQLGAYGGALRTGFNGFDRARLVEVSDPPLLQTPGYGPMTRAA